MALSYIDDLRSRSWVGFAEVAILAPELLIMRRRERSASSRIGIGRPWETKCWSAIAPCGLTRAHTHTRTVATSFFAGRLWQLTFVVDSILRMRRM